MSGSQEKPVGLYQDLPAVCREYDSRAPLVARYVATLISEKGLPAVTVEHIGSTSVEGCAGKGIVDLMVLYPEGQLDPAKSLLDELGFQRQSNRDPFPEDRPMRVGSVEYDGSLFRLHAHVLWAGSPEVKGLRLFRDRLRVEALLREEYVARKRAIIESGVTDAVDYSIIKGEFVSRVLESKE
jgi:GrpB-like predicted nucleotidyltransferase (UPF0157 family)